MHFYSSRQNGAYLPRHNPYSSKMGAKAHVNHPMSTRRRNMYIKYAIIAILALVIFLNWRTTADEIQAISPYTISITEKNKAPTTPMKDTEGAEDTEEDSGAAVEKKVEENTEPKIAIVTFTTSEKSYTYLSLKNKYAYANRHNYTLIVDYEAAESHDVGIMWHKFAMIEKLLAEGSHDWIWWIDFDTLITNLNIKLSDIVTESLYNVTSVFPAAKDPEFESKFVPAEADGVDPDNIDFLFTADCFPLNAGSMLVRGRLPANSQRTKPLTSADFLSRVRKYHAANASYEHQLSEQDCMRDMLFNDDPGYTKEHVRMIPQWKTNAFPEEIKCWDKDQRGWEPGTFAIHFAGAWAHVKEEDPTGFLMRKYEGQIVD